jgi:hypothetical protein
MDLIVVSNSGRANTDWDTLCGLQECDFSNNRVGIDSYFDEADMNS